MSRRKMYQIEDFQPAPTSTYDQMVAALMLWRLGIFEIEDTTIEEIGSIGCAMEPFEVDRLINSMITPRVRKLLKWDEKRMMDPPPGYVEME